MRNIRDVRLLARFVLVWFALSIGIAIASPLVNPQGVQLICSEAGAMKVVVTGDDGQPTPVGHTLDCPLCASISSPPPADAPGFLAIHPESFTIPPALRTTAPAPVSGPPPARAPPAASV